MKRLSLAIALLAVLISACSSEATRYEDAAAIASALEEEGISCADPEPVEPAELPSEAATCGTKDDTIAIYVFDDVESQDRWMTLGRELGPLVTGPNWAIDAGDEAEAIAEALDGTLE